MVLVLAALIATAATAPASETAVPAASQDGIRQGAIVDAGGAASLDGHRFIYQVQHSDGTWGPWQEWDLRGRRTRLFAMATAFSGQGVAVLPSTPNDPPSSAPAADVTLSRQEVMRLRLHLRFRQPRFPTPRY